MVLLIIATFAGPVYAVRSQDPSTLEGEVGWFRRLAISPWKLPAFLIVTALVSLILDLRDTAPLTRGAVFHIAFDVAAVSWGIFCVIAITNRVP